MNKSLSDFNRKGNSLEFTYLLLATYEIIESLDGERIAKRDEKFCDIYMYPDCNNDCDDYNSISFPPKNIFHSALNELGLLKLYNITLGLQNLVDP